MPLARLPEPFDHRDWIYELKYDGFRALTYVEDGRARLVSRKGNSFKSFPELTAAIAPVPDCRNAVLDGEIVHFGRDGKPEFYSLMRRRAPQHFCAFDLLWIDGRDLRGLPLLERRRLLHKIMPLTGCPVLYVDHVAERGVDLFRAVCAGGMEGIVAKLTAGYSQNAGRREWFERARAGQAQRSTC